MYPCFREIILSNISLVSFEIHLLDYYRLAFYVAAHLVRVAGGSRPMTLENR